MPQTLSLTALGVPVDVVIDGSGADQLAAAMAEPWASCQRTVSPDDAGDIAVDALIVRAFLDEDPALVQTSRAAGAVASGDLEEVLHELSPAVTMAVIEAQAGRLWMLHAACLGAAETGRAVALVGPSGTGKTTAARVLGRAFGYLTDETTGIDRHGRIWPYPKPLSQVVEGSELKEQIGPRALGLAAGPEVPVLAAVVLLHRVPGLVSARCEPVPIAQALPVLAEQTSYLTRLEPALGTVVDILGLADGVFAVEYGEAEQLISVVEELLEVR